MGEVRSGARTSRQGAAPTAMAARKAAARIAERVERRLSIGHGRAAESTAANSANSALTVRVACLAKPKGAPRGRPMTPGNTWRWRPGQSGNPHGRPKLLVGAYRQFLAAHDPETGLTGAQAIALVLVDAAIRGNVAAARELRLATEDHRSAADFSAMTDEELGAAIWELCAAIQEMEGGAGENDARAQSAPA